jgi:hypothetical protein
MNGGPNSNTSAAAEEEDIRIPDLLPPPLPPSEALRLADLAHVPTERHEQFFDYVHWTVALVWMRDRRAVGTSAGAALVRVAKAARTLHKELSKLDPVDRKWVERLWRRTPWYKDWLRDFPEAVFRLAHLFSSAVGMSPPRVTGVAASPYQKSDRWRTRKDVMFLDFVRRLRLVVSESGGELTLDQNYEKGTLLDALHILRPHLPNGVVPEKLPFGTLKKIKANSILDAPLAEIDFFSPEQSP